MKNKRAWGFIAALSLAACGGGQGEPGWDGFDGREDATAGREPGQDGREPASSDGSDDGDGGGTAGRGNTPPPDPGGAIESCSGSYDCGGGVVLELTRSGGQCTSEGDAEFVFEDDNSLTTNGVEVGTWSESSSSFRICIRGACQTCTEE